MDKKGFVYIMTNPDMPGLVKVGMTKRVPTERAKDDDMTGLPKPHETQYYAFFDDMARAEKEAHKKLQSYHHSKEWFKTDVATAIAAIESIDMHFNKLYSKPDDDKKAAQIKAATEAEKKRIEEEKKRQEEERQEQENARIENEKRKKRLIEEKAIAKRNRPLHEKLKDERNKIKYYLIGTVLGGIYRVIMMGDEDVSSILVGMLSGFMMVAAILQIGLSIIATILEWRWKLNNYFKNRRVDDSPKKGLR